MSLQQQRGGPEQRRTVEHSPSLSEVGLHTPCHLGGNRPARDGPLAHLVHHGEETGRKSKTLR